MKTKKIYQIEYMPFSRPDLRNDIKINRGLLNLKFDTLVQDLSSFNGNLYESVQTGKIFHIDSILRGYDIAHVIDIKIVSEEYKICDKLGRELNISDNVRLIDDYNTIGCIHSINEDFVQLKLYNNSYDTNIDNFYNANIDYVLREKYNSDRKTNLEFFERQGIKANPRNEIFVKFDLYK